MARPATIPAPRMDRVLRRIEHWRSTRRRLSPMPPGLWMAAVALAREHGVSMTSRILGLSYASLKERAADPARRAGRRRRVPVGFVELPPGSLTNTPLPAAAVLELWASDGAKLVVHLRESADLNLPGLAEAFWRRRS
jgi:hypothetical protein